MLSRKVLLFCAISTLFVGLRQESSYAADQPEWFGEHLSTRHLFIILRDSEIENELSMTPEQREALTDLQNRFRPRFLQVVRPAKDSATKSDEEKNALNEKRKADVSNLENEFRPQISKALTAVQRERLYQIIWQLNVARALSEETKVTSRIQLEAEQKVALSEIVNQYEKDLKANHQVLVREKTARALHSEWNEAAEMRRDEQALKILTDSQKSQWSMLVGKPLDVVALRPRVNLLRSDVDRAKAKPREELGKKPAI